VVTHHRRMAGQPYTPAGIISWSSAAVPGAGIPTSWVACSAGCSGQVLLKESEWPMSTSTSIRCARFPG
jgi:hypothetical protein